MRYLRWMGLLSSLLIVGVFGGLISPLPSDALTVKIDNAPVIISTTSTACSSGYNLCSFIPPGRYGNWTVGDVSSTNKARIMIGDNSAAGSLDLLKLTGITFTPVDTQATTKTTTVVVTHWYNAGGGNPAGDYAWGYGMAGYLDPPSTENIVGDQLKQTGQGNFAGRIAALGLGLDTGVFATPSSINLNGSVTKSRSATVVMPACNTGSTRCAPTITQTFTLTVKGGDKLVLSDSVIAAGATCRQVDQVIPIRPDLYALMLKLDPNAPNDINKLSAWLAKMGQKYLKSPKQKELLAYLIRELDKWLAETIPGTCPEIQEEINQVVADDVEAERVAAQAAGAVPAEPGGTITITKTTDQATSDTFTFTIISGESSSTETIPMEGQTSQEIVVTVEPGTYSITENELAGWSLNSSSCGGEGLTEGIVVAVGGNVECTFNNNVASGEASLMGLGDIPGGGTGSQVFDVSDAGAVVVGNGLGDSGQEASRWTAGTGMVSLTPGTFGQSTAVSSDGSVVVGFKHDTPGVPHAFRWTTGTGLADLGVLPSSGSGSNTSNATAVSADGNVVVGVSTYTSMFGVPAIEAFRWTATGGMVGLGDLAGPPFLSQATAVSADGSVIVGWAIGASGQEMFRWTSPGPMQGLGVLQARPTAVSGDGSIIVGEITNGGFTDAFHWSQATGRETLPGLGGSLDGLRSIATDISGDGSIIVGRAVSPEDNEAVIWRKVNGSWTIETLEAAVGSTDSRLITAEGVSADGRTIVGNAGTLFGVNRSEGYRIVLPE